MAKNKNEQKKHLFGRNLFTLLFVLIGGTLLFLIVYTISSYATIGNDNKITPFVSAASDGCEVTFDTENVTRMNGKDFKEFELEFVCEEYSEASKKAKFSIKAYKNENTKSVTNKVKQQYAVCVSADWVGFASYSTEELSSSFYIYDSAASASSTSTTVYELIDFPAKANTWPVPVTVEAPDVYVYISYTYYKVDGATSGDKETKNYILKYSYSELDVKIGGIER